MSSLQAHITMPPYRQRYNNLMNFNIRYTTNTLIHVLTSSMTQEHGYNTNKIVIDATKVARYYETLA